MSAVSALSGPVPRGLRVVFLVLTVLVIAVAVFAAVRGLWFVTVICGVFVPLNLAALWIARGSTRGAPARD